MTRKFAASADRANDHVDRAVARFGSAVAPLLRAGDGQGEANLTAPVERLLRDMASMFGLDLLSHREVADRSLGVRPDLAIDVAGARVGVVELKAPGYGVPGPARWGRSRDRAQWEKLKLLPNVLYTDGSSWALFHYGERSHPIANLDGDLSKAGSRLRVKDDWFLAVMKDFLYWKPDPPRSLRDLIKIAAGLCQLLREEVSGALGSERSGTTKAFFTEHLADWQEWLFPDLTDDEFVDAYAQTITFGLLLARREGVIFEGLEIPDIGEKLAKRHLLVGRALSILTARPDRGRSIEERSIVLQTMRRVIGVADWTQWPTAGSYHWLYEEFLEKYDPLIRRKMGAYYTPSEVTDFMVRFVDEVLQSRLHVDRGLADDDVVVLDPAMGTGTFLQSVVDRVAHNTTDEGGDVPAALRDLLRRLIGFERQIGPYAVAELKLDQALDAHRAEAKDEDFRLYIADTLDDPNKLPLPARAHMYAPLADSRRHANRVKTDEPVMVVMGNPPYRSKAKRLGKWVLDSHAGKRSLLDDFRSPGNGRHEYKLHDMAVYFWRWALWKAFESTPDRPAGIVTFITTYAFLNGPGFAGMRRYLRERADVGWVIDLSAEGHWSRTTTRIFPGVPHPVCIAVFAREANACLDRPAPVRYVAISGNQAEKFQALRSVTVDGTAWEQCPNGWTEPMRPMQPESWTQHPSVDDLLPYTSLGVTCNRTWVHAPTPATLRQRWRILVQASSQEKSRLMKETGDRTIDSTVRDIHGSKRLRRLRDESSTSPRLQRIGFRSFDRQYLIADKRVVDRIRPDLWRINSPTQVYLVTQLREALSAGPAAVFTAHVPDTHHFQGHHGGRVIPLYSDDGDRPNVAPGLCAVLSRRYGVAVAGDDVMAYIAGLLAHSGYTRVFSDELRQPGVRVPLTAVKSLWCEAVSLGRHSIALHTFGERMCTASVEQALRAARPSVLSPVPGQPHDMPDEISHDSVNDVLIVGAGRLGPVSRAVWDYEVSGMHVVRHWFDYRRRNPKERTRTSKLDGVLPDRWTREMTEELRNLIAVLHCCVRLEPSQADLLEEILTSPLITTTDLENEQVLPVPSGARRLSPFTDHATLF